MWNGKAFDAPCDNEREPDGEPCDGTLRFGPWEVQAQCDTCGGWTGRHAPGVRATGEKVCHRCHRPNICWSAPSLLWNAVMRGGDINGVEPYGGIVCPCCFAELAEEKGFATTVPWRMDETPSTVSLVVQPKDLKATREALCAAQGALSAHAAAGLDADWLLPHLERIQRLIDQIDIARPLGTDGKHADQHTPLCGCDD